MGSGGNGPYSGTGGGSQKHADTYHVVNKEMAKDKKDPDIYNPNDSSKRSPHPTLIGGKDPQVQCAGMITFKNGKIYSYDNSSGHFRPNSKSLPKVKAALDKLYKENPNLFDKGSEWRKK